MNNNKEGIGKDQGNYKQNKHEIQFVDVPVEQEAIDDHLLNYEGEPSIYSLPFVAEDERSERNNVLTELNTEQVNEEEANINNDCFLIMVKDAPVVNDDNHITSGIEISKVSAVDNHDINLIRVVNLNCIELNNTQSGYCVTCTKRFENFHELEEHIRSHGNERSSNRSEDLKYLALSAEDNKVSVAVVETELNLNDHEEKTRDLDKTRFIDKNTKEVFESEDFFIKVGFNENLRCDHCKLTFNSPRHLLDYHKNSCINLTLNGIKISDLKQHVILTEDYKCSLCQKQHNTKVALEYHMKSHTDERPFKCDECDHTAKRRTHLRYHYWDKHNKPTEVEEETNKTNFCTICNKYCGTPGKLKRHMFAHTKPFHCNICDMSFSYPTSLKRHVSHHIGGEKRFKCHDCQNVYNSKDSLKYHIKTHTGEKPFHCTECSFVTKTNKQLRSHFKRIHETSGRCSDCAIDSDDSF